MFCLGSPSLLYDIDFLFSSSPVLPIITGLLAFSLSQNQETLCLLERGYTKACRLPALRFRLYVTFQTREWEAASMYSLTWSRRKKCPKRKNTKAIHFCSIMVTYTQRLDQSATRTVMGLIKWSKKEKPSRETMNTTSNKQSDTGKRLMYTVLSVAEKQVACERWEPKLSFKPHSCTCPQHTGTSQDKKQ